jgi:hypothetical protein
MFDLITKFNGYSLNKCLINLPSSFSCFRDVFQTHFHFRKPLRSFQVQGNKPDVARDNIVAKVTEQNEAHYQNNDEASGN